MDNKQTCNLALRRIGIEFTVTVSYPGNFHTILSTSDHFTSLTASWHLTALRLIKKFKFGFLRSVIIFKYPKAAILAYRKPPMTQQTLSDRFDKFMSVDFVLHLIRVEHWRKSTSDRGVI